MQQPNLVREYIDEDPNQDEKVQCPDCARLGFVRHLRWFYLNMEEAIFKCEGEMCMFPNENFKFKNFAENTIYRFRAAEMAPESFCLANTNFDFLQEREIDHGELEKLHKELDSLLSNPTSPTEAATAGQSDPDLNFFEDLHEILGESSAVTAAAMKINGMMPETDPLADLIEELSNDAKSPPQAQPIIELPDELLSLDKIVDLPELKTTPKLSEPPKKPAKLYKCFEYIEKRIGKPLRPKHRKKSGKSPFKVPSSPASGSSGKVKSLLYSPTKRFKEEEENLSPLQFLQRMKIIGGDVKPKVELIEKPVKDEKPVKFLDRLVLKKEEPIDLEEPSPETITTVKPLPIRIKVMPILLKEDVVRVKKEEVKMEFKSMPKIEQEEEEDTVRRKIRPSIVQESSAEVKEALNCVIARRRSLRKPSVTPPATSPSYSLRSKA